MAFKKLLKKVKNLDLVTFSLYSLEGKNQFRHFFPSLQR